MTLRVKYFLFVGVIHAILAILAFFVLEEKRVLFFLAEIVIIISLVLSYQLYKAFIRPLQFLYTGMDAIEDQDFNVKFRLTGSREMDKLINVYNAMIDNIRNERIFIEEQQFFLQRLIDSSPVGIIMLDFDDNVSDYNPAVERIIGKDVLQKQAPIPYIVHPVLQKLSGLSPGFSDIVSAKGYGKYKCEVSTFIQSGFQRKFITIQELSKEILEAEKRAYGKVIRMMAHEVNNSIGAVNSILESVTELYHDEDQNMEADVKMALKVAVQRNTRLDKFMKNFASVVRVPDPQLKPVWLNEALLNVSKLMEQQANLQNIHFEYQLSAQEQKIEVDIQQIEQVLVNIIKNAIEAIPHSGTVRFRTTAFPPSILIENNGDSISSENAGKLFSPFFSTKQDGQGVGLTLVREILLNHQAKFDLRTRDDGWTVFEINFRD